MVIKQWHDGNLKINISNSAIWLLAFLLSTAAFSVRAESEFRLGYRLDYLLGTVDASQIDPSFPEISQGHTSSFFLGKEFLEHYFWQIDIGAWNADLANNAQFTYQYSMVEVGYKGSDSVFLIASAGIGGALAAITQGAPGIGAVQTGKILRDDLLLFVPTIGIGYRINKAWEGIVEIRRMNYMSATNSDNLFSKLNSTVGGISISSKL